MPQIILKERKAHLASYTLFTGEVDQYKDMSLSQLYQPPRALFSQNMYHQLLLSCEYCKVFKNSFFPNLQRVVCRCSSKQLFLKVLQTSQESTHVGGSFQKNLQAQGLQLYITAKKTSTQVFSCEVYEIFKKTFFIEYLW